MVRSALLQGWPCWILPWLPPAGQPRGEAWCGLWLWRAHICPQLTHYGTTQGAALHAGLFLNDKLTLFVPPPLQNCQVTHLWLRSSSLLMLGTKQLLQPLQTLQQPQVRTRARLPPLLHGTILCGDPGWAGRKGQASPALPSARSLLMVTWMLAVVANPHPNLGHRYVCWCLLPRLSLWKNSYLPWFLYFFKQFYFILDYFAPELWAFGLSKVNTGFEHDA